MCIRDRSYTVITTTTTTTSTTTTTNNNNNNNNNSTLEKWTIFTYMNNTMTKLIKLF